jgi:hypothetical protein
MVTTSFSTTKSTALPATVYIKEAVGGVLIFVKVNACVWLENVKHKIANRMVIFFMYFIFYNYLAELQTIKKTTIIILKKNRVVSKNKMGYL